MGAQWAQSPRFCRLLKDSTQASIGVIRRTYRKETLGCLREAWRKKGRNEKAT